jgi:transcriptional regulator with XRE-family HTH domain
MRRTLDTQIVHSTPLPVRREAVSAGLDLTGLTYAEISRATGISPSMLSRMFSDDPEQKRANPSLYTLLTLREFLEKHTGKQIALDTLVEAIT